MRRGLIKITGADGDRELLAEAADYAAGSGASLLLLVVVSEETLTANSETMERIAEAEQTSYGTDAVIDSVEQPVREIANDVLDERGIDYEIRTRVTDDAVGTILEVGERESCDHLFLVGSNRSPTGKAVFGDETQRALLNFDGFVTVILD